MENISSHLSPLFRDSRLHSSTCLASWSEDEGRHNMGHSQGILWRNTADSGLCVRWDSSVGTGKFFTQKLTGRSLALCREDQLRGLWDGQARKRHGPPRLQLGWGRSSGSTRARMAGAPCFVPCQERPLGLPLGAEGSGRRPCPC